MKQTGRDILWVDADAIFKRYPIELDDCDADVGVHKFHWADRGIREILSGTVYLRNSEGGFKIAEEWARNADDIGLEKTWEQKALDAAVEKNRNVVKVRWLPPEYCTIFDITRRFHPDVDPVIEHYQASRRLSRTEKDDLTGVPS